MNLPQGYASAFVSLYSAHAWQATALLGLIIVLMWIYYMAKNNQVVELVKDLAEKHDANTKEIKEAISWNGIGYIAGIDMSSDVDCAGNPKQDDPTPTLPFPHPPEGAPPCPPPTGIIAINEPSKPETIEVRQPIPIPTAKG